MKLRIGLGMNFAGGQEGPERAYLDRHYFDTLSELGTCPLPLIPTEDVVLLEALLRQLDGLVMTGGLDLDPALWQEDRHERTRLLHPRRQRFDLLLYQQACKHRLPILGICLGIQVINVAHGGSLHQYLPDVSDQVDHGGDGRTTRHALKLDPASRLGRWFSGDQVTVGSSHQQAVARVGRGLRAAAWAADDVVEAVERDDYPFLLGVQWHPERDGGDPVNRVVWEHFLGAAAAHASGSPAAS
ncbi:MAG: gamma-glutamyl-gamma-aminobutyrate hydrolase family protein [Sedimentisphaerales bacterium]|nr:gamma-glutamyl-gamma-aminobutyrate hydrolase family protein [Sedimentisphaerales bacterium]